MLRELHGGGASRGHGGVLNIVLHGILLGLLHGGSLVHMGRTLLGLLGGSLGHRGCWHVLEMPRPLLVLL